jgi:hypothetical protein
MTTYTKIAIICTLLVTVGCTATLIVVNSSDRTSIDTDSDPKLDSGLHVEVHRDSITKNK